MTDADGADWPPETNPRYREEPVLRLVDDMGTWTVTIEAGPGLMSNLAAMVRMRDLSQIELAPGAWELLADGLERATFTPGDLLDSALADANRIIEDTERTRRKGRLIARRTDGRGGPGVQAPKYAHDAGLDLALADDLEISPGEQVNADCGAAVALPPGTFGWITGRSSTWHTHGLMVVPAIIDEGWRGGLFAAVYRPWKPGSQKPLILPQGTRIAQLIVLPNMLDTIEVVHTAGDLPRSERGTNGFGSSGR